MLNRRLFLLTVSLLLLTGAVFAQVGTIAGTVMLPPQGGPAVGATVTIYRMNMDSVTTTSDSLGHFQFDSVAVGEWGVHAYLNAYVPGFGVVHVRSGHTEHILLVLHNPPTGYGVVRGVVLLPMPGGPAAGATVWLFRALHDSMVTTADDSGRFVFDSARVGLHDLHAALTGYIGAHIQVRVIDGETVPVVLLLRPIPVPEYGNVHGSVVFGADSLPAANVTVTLFPERPGDSLITTTDAQGQFAFDSVRTGGYDVRAELAGYLPAIRDVLVRNGQTSQVRLVLRVAPTAVVSGLVTLADATPVSHAFVVMFVTGHHFGREFHALTDSLGHFGFEHVPAGSYTVNAMKPHTGFGTAQITVVDGQTTDVTIVLNDSSGGTRAPTSASAVDDVTPLPVKQFMADNYPNPFNPTTTISYSVPTASFVRLSVYDVLGRKVADLVNGYRDVGSYNVSFNGENLPSGIYLYRFTAGNFSHTGRMTLLK